MPGIPCTQSLTQFKFYFQYQPNGIDTAECCVELLSNGTPVTGGTIKMNATSSMGWQQDTIDFAYINDYTPDMLYILFSSTSLDYAALENSKLWLDDVSVTLPSGIEQKLDKDDELLVSPNLSNGIFSVQYTGNGPQPLPFTMLLKKRFIQSLSILKQHPQLIFHSFLMVFISLTRKIHEFSTIKQHQQIRHYLKPPNLGVAKSGFLALLPTTLHAFMQFTSLLHE